MKSISRILAFVSFLLIGSGAFAEQLSESNFKSSSEAKGTVLVAVNWGRQWNCGAYENAQLEKLKFTSLGNNSEQLFLESPSRVFVDSKFLNYGFLLEPGEYALSEFSVKVAKSVSDVGYFSAGAEQLVVGGKPEAGSFIVKPGEIVYVGHFFLDCYKDPIPWRYYPEGKEGFEGYKRSVKKEFGYLPIENVKFRLFKTSQFGSPYEQ